MADAAIFLCAGRGSRMKGVVEDKVLEPLAGKPVLLHSVEAFLKAEIVKAMVFVFRDKTQRQQIVDALSVVDLGDMEIQWVQGGEERQDSVFHALTELSLVYSNVFIHDAARPLVCSHVLQELQKLVWQDKAVCLAHRVVDTIKEVKSGASMRKAKLRNLNRSHLWAMETPQVFDREMILEAYRKLRLDNIRVTDDTAAVSAMGKSVTLLENHFPNPKITNPDDIAYVEFLLSRKFGVEPASDKP